MEMVNFPDTWEEGGDHVDENDATALDDVLPTVSLVDEDVEVEGEAGWGTHSETGVRLPGN